MMLHFFTSYLFNVVVGLFFGVRPIQIVITTERFLVKYNITARSGVIDDKRHHGFVFGDIYYPHGNARSVDGYPLIHHISF